MKLSDNSFFVVLFLCFFSSFVLFIKCLCNWFWLVFMWWVFKIVSLSINMQCCILNMWCFFSIYLYFARFYFAFLPAIEYIIRTILQQICFRHSWSFLNIYDFLWVLFFLCLNRNKFYIDIVHLFFFYHSIVLIFFIL